MPRFPPSRGIFCGEAMSALIMSPPLQLSLRLSCNRRKADSGTELREPVDRIAAATVRTTRLTRELLLLAGGDYDRGE
jgi:hypothetical protein